MREIIPGWLWIANTRAANDIRGVLSVGVKAVIDLAIEEPPIIYPRDIIYCRLPLIDGEGNSSTVINLAVDLAATCLAERTSLLISCSAGMSRSQVIAAAAISRVRKIPLKEALAEVAAGAPHDISPGLWTEVEQTQRRQTPHA
jgi:hypothetical protein